MSEETVNRAAFEVVDATPDDVEGIKRVQAAGWLATYPNEEAGITREDIEEYPNSSERNERFER